MKTFFSILGFAMFIIGFVGLVLTLVGIKLTILHPLEILGPLGAFLSKIGFIIFGIIIVYFSKTDWERENQP